MAFTSYTDWDVQSGGDNSNGGSFAAAWGGTDRAQQTNAQVVIDNAAIIATVNGNTVTFSSGYIPTAADPGNCVNLIGASGGTLPTYSRYQITARSATTWTLDRTTGAVTSTLTSAKMGGCLSSPVTAMTYLNTSPNQRVFVKYSATPYTITGTVNMVQNQGDYYGNYLEGYYAAHGDLPSGANRPTIVTNGAITALTQPSLSYWTIACLILDGNGATRGNIGISSAGNTFVWNCKFLNFAQEGVKQTGNIALFGCEVTNCGLTGGTVAVACNLVRWCWIHDNAKPGTSCHFLTFSVISNNAGVGAKLTSAFTILNCVIYGNTGHGVDVAGNFWVAGSCLANTVLARNGGFGFSAWNHTGRYNFGGGNVTWSNTSGSGFTGNGAAGVGPGGLAANPVISGTDPTNDPFLNKALNDYTPNATAGAGAVLRGAAWPPTWAGLTAIDYRDVGAIQHHDAGVGGSAAQLLNGGNLA